MKSAAGRPERRQRRQRRMEVRMDWAGAGPGTHAEGGTAITPRRFQNTSGLMGLVVAATPLITLMYSDRAVRPQLPRGPH